MYRKYLPLLLAAVIALVSMAAMPARHAGKPYTIMIYMNGSDLESEFGAATDDLVEMLESGLDSRNANVLILTGGAKRWMNDAIPETEVIIWELADGFLNELESMGKVNMGHPDTLRDFIEFGLDYYPARRYGLIMWDHGGGSIAGFGHDEKFNDASLSLLDMQKAFEESGLRKTKLEFLGFDACLMATVEMAVLAADYAHVMIASEDLEPGDGWDYVFLGALNKNPHMDGFALGKIITDTFMDFYGPNSDEILSLSVVDLSRVKPVMNTMGRLMARTEPNASRATFRDLATRRANTKTFGEGSPRDNYADMVDIGDMAIQLMELYPKEAVSVLKALSNCVTYNRHNSDVELYGLSTFYIYGGKSQGEPSLEIYSDLDMDSRYTEYLHHFFDGLRHSRRHRSSTSSADIDYLRTELALWRPVDEGKNIYRMTGLLQTAVKEDLLWPQLCGHPVVLYPVAATANIRQYAVPAMVNGRDADLIVTFSKPYPEGKVVGIRHNSGNVIQKGYDPINPSDKIALYYPERNFTTGTESWHKGETFSVPTSAWEANSESSEVLLLHWDSASQHKLGFRHTDYCGDVFYTMLN